MLTLRMTEEKKVAKGSYYFIPFTLSDLVNLYPLIFSPMLETYPHRFLLFLFVCFGCLAPKLQEQPHARQQAIDPKEIN